MKSIERFATIVPCGYSGLEIHDKERSIHYVKRGFFLYMDRPYVINPFPAKVMRNTSKYITKLENKPAISEEISEKYGINNNEQNTDEGRVTNRLLDYVRKRNGRKMTKEERADLYNMYLYEWIYLLTQKF